MNYTFAFYNGWITSKYYMHYLTILIVDIEILMNTDSTFYDLWTFL